MADHFNTLDLPGVSAAGAAAGTDVFTSRVSGDSADRLVIDADGTIQWGSGSGAPDTVLRRAGADALETPDSFTAFGNVGAGVQLLLGGTGQLSNPSADVVATPDEFAVTTAGKGLSIKEGSNARMGTVTLNGASEVTVSTTAVTANSRIFLTANTPGGTPAGVCWVSSRSPGTSFGVTGAAGDSSDVAWFIVEPA